MIEYFCKFSPEVFFQEMILQNLMNNFLMKIKYKIKSTHTLEELCNVPRIILTFLHALAHLILLSSPSHKREK